MALNEYEIKKMMCDVGKRIYDRNMVAANDGNISVKLNDNEFLCTPTGVSLSLIHISEPTRRTPISYAVFCLKKKKTKLKNMNQTDIKHKNISFTLNRT